MFDIDYKKILREDEEFKEFCAEALVKSIVEDQPDFIKAIHSFYQMGMRVEQVVKFIKDMSRGSYEN